MTTNLDFVETHLIQMLDQLPPAFRVAFAAACAERLQPSYRRFFELTHRGNPEALSDNLKILWQDLRNSFLSEKEIEARIKSCMALTPREGEGKWSTAQALAEDAGAAVVYALRCRRKGESKESAWAARRAYEAVDYFVVHRDNVKLHQAEVRNRIRLDPLVQAELSRQQRDLSELRENQIDIEGLKERATKEANSFVP